MKSAKKYKKKKISQQHAGERLYNLRKTHTEQSSPRKMRRHNNLTKTSNQVDVCV